MFTPNLARSVNDCYRTSLSCLLGVRADVLTNFADPLSSTMPLDKINKELSFFNRVAIVQSWEGELEDLTGFFQQTYGPDYLYLVSGLTVNGGPHCWVFKGREVFHNVTPDAGTVVFPFNKEGVSFQTTQLGYYVKS